MKETLKNLNMLHLVLEGNNLKIPLLHYPVHHTLGISINLTGDNVQ